MMDLCRRLGIPLDMFEEMARQAALEWPTECCGLVTTPTHGWGTDLRLKHCRNAYDQLRAQAPETYPRDARTAFVIDPVQQLEVDRENRTEGRDIFLFYHSHPQHDAYFSEEDKAAALFPFDQPTFPEALHLVLSILDRKLEAACWARWNFNLNDFISETWRRAEPTK